MENKEVKGRKAYKNKIVFLRLSKAGNHVFAFNNDGALGGEVESLIANVKEVTAVLDGSAEYAKMSVLKVSKAKEEEGDENPFVPNLLHKMKERAEVEGLRARGILGEPQ